MADVANRCSERRETAVRQIAAALGKPWGHCGKCRWPGVLIAAGLIPFHRTGSSRCPGTENPPAEEGGAGV